MFLDFFRNIAKEKALLVRFKKEAKELQKNSAMKNVTLEQCERDIAKKYGYPSWELFETDLACKKPSSAEKNRLITTRSPTPDAGILYLGYDVLMSNYRWIKSTNVINALVLGEDRYDNYDFHLAMQAIQQGRNVTFINGKGDVETVEKLIDVAKEVGRDKELAVYSLHDVEAFSEYKKCLVNKYTDIDLFSNAMLGLIMFPESYDPAFQKWYMLAQNMLELLVPLYVHTKRVREPRNKNLTYTFKEFFDFLDVKSLRFNFSYIESLPVELQRNILTYLSELPGFKEQNMEKVWETHNWITKMIKGVIDSLSPEDIDLFDADGDSYESLFVTAGENKGFIRIINLNDNNDSLKNLVSYCYFAGMQKRVDEKFDPNKDDLDVDLSYVFIRETPVDVPTAFYVRSKAIGISMYFSYKNEDSVNKYVADPNGLLHNVSLSVVSLPQSDFYPDVAEFPKQAQEQTVLLKKDGVTLQLYLPRS